MKIGFSLSLAFFAAVVVSATQPKIQLVIFVSFFIGTGGHGHTYPGANLPYGILKVGHSNSKNG